MTGTRETHNGAIATDLDGIVASWNREAETITAYARILADGRVEVLACAESVQVDTFIGRLWTGPAAASVTGLETAEQEAAERPSAFTIA